MSFHGAPYEPKTPMDANKAGVGMVFQEQSLIVTLNVAQNIFFGHEKGLQEGRRHQLGQDEPGGRRGAGRGGHHQHQPHQKRSAI